MNATHGKTELNGNVKVKFSVTNNATLNTCFVLTNAKLNCLREYSIHLECKFNLKSNLIFNSKN